jgi:hypothetical protein
MHQSPMQVIIFDGSDQDIVHVYKYHSRVFVSQSLEDSIHCMLEGCGQVCEAEKHDLQLIEAVRCLEGRFPPVFHLDKHVVIP